MLHVTITWANGVMHIISPNFLPFTYSLQVPFLVSGLHYNSDEPGPQIKRIATLG